ncbi:MAG: hypothetical protein Q8M94_08060, partial [Ignavibacteria bacterium]|nr:hypothetical protein [Ignavibacteria bacterium]
MKNYQPNMKSYEEEYKSFSWQISRNELGYNDGDVINIGEYCTDRICRLGKANKLALIWEGYDGVEKKYTFDDMRILTNTIAFFLQKLGIKHGDRVCLFMDKV